MRDTSQKGSAIVWVFIAVGLFAALSFTFTQSNRTSTNLIDDEQATAYANQIIASGNEVKNAVKRLQLRGCSDTEISFENNIVSGYTNPNSPTDKKCHVFDTAGGGLSWNPPPQNSLDQTLNTNQQYGLYTFTGDASVVGIGTDCADESCNELMMMLGFITEQQCSKLNDSLNINSDLSTSENIGNVPPNNNSIFDGVYNLSGTNAIGDNDTAFSNQKSGCIKRGNASNGHTYYQVLIAR